VPRLLTHIAGHLAQERLLLLVLLAALPFLLWQLPEQLTRLHELVHWQTIAALTGLMLLSRALEARWLFV
jgi:di/tricarboxylate transporter